ncbi:MAG: outer membrane protein assembly factor BamE [Ferrovum sp.]|nr:outer membrane protein assembly factor BamE [Ferrovum sp.]
MIRSAVVLLLLALSLAGCSSLSMPSMPSFSLPSWKLPSWDSLSESIPKLSSIKPYTLDIQQGVVIDGEMIGRLKTGMTRTQVGYVLGTPLLADPFHANRWDYVFYTRKQRKLSQPRDLTVFFKADKLERFAADYVLPSPAVATTATAAPAITPAAPAATQPVAPAPTTAPVPAEAH